MNLVKQNRMKQSYADEIFHNKLVFETSPFNISKQIKKVCLVYNDWMQPIEFFNYFIIDGDWDVNFDYFYNDRIYKEMIELNDAKENYKNITSYKKNIEELMKGEYTYFLMVYYTHQGLQGIGKQYLTY